MSEPTGACTKATAEVSILISAYRPGPKNQKADTLSRQQDVPNEEMDSELIIPSSRIVAAVIWSIETTVRQAQT
jgi:hypothetical protein